ncbi:MAG: phenolic acid decarboxylase, partial [Gammaproteobacteria bacterium]|nr:phenolic acid decarboxylase [Gammaproteobacteria bacterium]
ATITFVRDCGANNDDVIACAASELPKNFPENLR